MNAPEINAILDRLPVVYWPVFFAEFVWLRLFRRDLWSETGGFAMLGVTRRGRIVLLGMFINDAPDETDWTRHAPRAPWLKPRAGALVRVEDAARRTLRIPAHRDGRQARPAACSMRPVPAFLDSG